MSANPAPPHRHTRVLACVLCQHRKIKCDRNFPCANCLKANVSCTPSTPAPARKRRRPNQDLQERLSRCEALLKQYADGAPPPPQDPSPRTPAVGQARSEPCDSAPISPGSPDTLKRARVIVNDEGGARFMDSYIWASVYEELQAMRDIIETDEPEDSSILGSEDVTPDNNTELFFPGSTPLTNIEDLQPDPVHAFKLWQLFLDRVNPLTKIIHAPTVQPYLMDAVTSMSSVPVSYQALLFSIYNMAVISLSETECVQTLGISRDAAFQRFSTGVKTALSRQNFLKNYNMSVLQALVLFLFSLQGRYDRHAAWILSGTIVRIAQKMGYHRDGEQLNLDPFETEMRRRIWWQIAILDHKYGMLSGLGHTVLPLRWDTEMPQNVNDADIIPGSREPIQSRQGPTEMGFCLILHEIHKFGRAAETTSAAPVFEAAVLGQDLGDADDSNSPMQATLTHIRVKVRELEAKLIEIEKQCLDINAGNVHKAVLCMRPMITNKLSEMLVPVREQPEWGTEIFGPKDSLFKVVITGHEQRMDALEKLQHTGFTWFIKLHFQLDTFAVMTGQLCHRPTGSLADRAWAVMGSAYKHHDELYDMAQKQYLIQAQFTLKAWKARERAFMQAGRALETPHFILRLRELVPQSHDGRSSVQLSTTPPNLPSTQKHSHQQWLAPLDSEQQQQQQYQQNGQTDPLLGGYLDMTSLNWDVFGDMVGNGGEPLDEAMFGDVGLGSAASEGLMGAASSCANPNAF